MYLSVLIRVGGKFNIIMDSEMIWDILKLPNFEYYPAGCAILEYGADSP